MGERSYGGKMYVELYKKSDVHSIMMSYLLLFWGMILRWTGKMHLFFSFSNVMNKK